jgi:ATP-binding cassette subfamily B protein RaxB
MPGLTGTVAQILALAVALEILGILSPLFMQIVVDSAIVSEDRDLITVLAVGFVLLALIQVGITALRAWMLTFLGTHVNLRLISNLFRHLLRLPVSFFEKRHIGDVVSRFESISTIQRTLTNSFLAAILDGVVAIATLSMMFLYSAKLTGVVLLASVLYATLRFTLLKPYRAVTEEQIVRAARQQSHFLETIRGIQSVKLFNRQNLRFTAWQNLAVDTFNSAVHAQRFVILYQALNGLLFGIENVVVIWLGAHATLDGAFSVGMLFAYVSYKLQFVTRVGALIDKSIEYRMLALHRDRVSDIALAPAETPAVIPQPVSRSLCPSIEVDNVTFRYSDGEPPVLRHLSFSIGADECVAIVGPSGCGKTTLLKIMLGLLTPTEGEVRIGGCRLAQLGVEGFRSLVGVVMQDDQLFSGSIADNISFFDPQIDMQRVVACAETAAIHGELAAMPMGYQTLVGDMGTTLSGGQKQRVLLARALYRQPKILFLDEATSHLDVDGERAVNEAIARIPMTRVLIAHRPETIRMAQRVIQLKSPASASSGARHVREVGS